MQMRSRVFLGSRRLVASIMLVPFTGESLTLKKGTVYRGVDRSGGLISSAMVAAMDEKKHYCRGSAGTTIITTV